MNMQDVQTHFTRAVITKTFEHFFSSVQVKQVENPAFSILMFKINSSGTYIFSASQTDKALLPQGENSGEELTYASVRMFVVEKVDDGQEANPRNLTYQNGCSARA